MRCSTTFSRAVFTMLCIVGCAVQVTATIAVSVYMKDDVFGQANASQPSIYITNTGNEVLNNFVYYYYFTTENGQIPVLDQYYLTGCESVTLEPVATGYRVKYTVTNANCAPGNSVPQGGNSIGLHYNDWSAWDKTNDFSNGQTSTMQLNQNIAVYVNNVKIYGNEPAPPAPPAAPTNLSTVAVSKQRIDISWTDNANSESGFKIERSVNSGSFTEVATVGSNTTSWQSTGLTANTPYSFRVRAYNSSGSSDYSNTSTISTHLAPDGFISFEKWTGITGTAVTAIPVNTTASSTGTLSLLEELPNQGGDNFGIRIRGYITAPATGSYTFWIAGDDDCQLWISSNDLPANKVKRAEVVGWTGYQIWNKFTSQQSPAITLNEGNKYYVEILHKEGVGDNNCSVGWKIPGQSSTTPVIVPGSVLSPYVTATAPVVPTGLSAVALSSSLINISWTDNNTTETSYKLERAIGSGSYSEIADLPANSTTYQNSGLTASTEYHYKIRACNGAGCSGYSLVETETTPAQSSNTTSLSLLSFAVYSNDQSMLRDRCTFSGGGAIGSNTYVEVGAGAVVNGNVVSGGNAYLRSDSRVNGDVTVNGTVNGQTGSSATTIQEGASIATVVIPQIASITTGTTSKTVLDGQVETIYPGIYNELTIHTGGTVKFKAGTYTFSSITLWAGAHILYDMSMYDFMDIYVKDKLDIHDRSDLKFMGTNTYAPAVRIYTNDPDEVRLGVDVQFTGILIAPLAEIQMFDGASCDGALYAKKILIEAVSTVNSGIVNPEKDFDNDYVKTFSEYKLRTDPYNPLEYTAIGLPDYAMIDNSSAQNVTYDFSRFFKGYSRATEVKGEFPANSLSDPTSPILFQIRNMPSTAPEYNDNDYQPIGRYMEPVYNTLLSGGTVSIGMPLPDDILPGAQLKVAVYRGGAWEELNGITGEQAVYFDISGTIGPMILVQKSRDAVVYYDNAVYSSQSMVKINIDLLLRNGTTTATPPGTFIINFTDYSSNPSGMSGTRTLPLIRQADGTFVLQDMLSFSGRVVVTSTVLSVAAPDNITYGRSLIYDLSPEQSLTISNDKTIAEMNGPANIPDKQVFAYNTENLSFEYSSIADEGQIRKNGSSYSYNYYLKDHLGSTRMVINDDGDIVQALMYQPYGTTSNVSGIVSGSTDPLREKFTGKELDEDGKVNGAPGIGQIYFGARFYDPELGIWKCVDPTSQFWNSYSYGPNNPINGIDPDGRFWFMFFYGPDPPALVLFQKVISPALLAAAKHPEVAIILNDIAKGYTSSRNKPPEEFFGKIGYFGRYTKDFLRLSYGGADVLKYALNKYIEASLNLDFTINSLIDLTVMEYFQLAHLNNIPEPMGDVTPGDFTVTETINGKIAKTPQD